MVWLQAWLFRDGVSEAVVAESGCAHCHPQRREPRDHRAQMAEVEGVGASCADGVIFVFPLS